MRIVKTYVCIGAYTRVLVLNAGGEFVFVRFKNGNLASGKKGCFVTDNEDLQDALEKSDAFNKLYYLQSTVKEDFRENERGNDGFTNDLTELCAKTKQIAIELLKNNVSGLSIPATISRCDLEGIANSYGYYITWGRE